jgi:hypothetical protein
MKITTLLNEIKMNEALQLVNSVFTKGIERVSGISPKDFKISGVRFPSDVFSGSTYEVTARLNHATVSQGQLIYKVVFTYMPGKKPIAIVTEGVVFEADDTSKERIIYKPSYKQVIPTEFPEITDVKKIFTTGASELLKFIGNNKKKIYALYTQK